MQPPCGHKQHAARPPRADPAPALAVSCAPPPAQFERTIIVAEEGAYVSYLEGCTAPAYDSNQVGVTARSGGDPAGQGATLHGR